MTGATSYDVMIGLTPTTLAAAAGSPTATTTLTVAGLTAGATYYWQVRGTTPNDSQYSEMWSFVIPPGAPGAIVAPVIGTLNVTIDTILVWTAGAGATSYEVEIADNSAFTDPLMTGTTTNAFISATDLPYGTRLYWRVRSVAAGVAVSGWTIGIFDTMAEAPPVPEIIAPESGATDVQLRPTFMWTEVEGKPFFDFEIASNYMYTDPVVSRTSLTTTVFALDSDLE
jgi:hypothetical protein